MKIKSLKNNAIKVFIAVSGLMLLTACSSSSGGGGLSEFNRTLNSAINSYTQQSIDATKDASGATARRGSVTQSSSRTATEVSGVFQTNDRIEATLTYEGSELQATIRNNGPGAEWTTLDDPGSSSSTTEYTGHVGTRPVTGLVHRTWYGVDRGDDDLTILDDSFILFDLFTDRRHDRTVNDEVVDDTDYWAAGIWLHTKPTREDFDDGDVGVFINVYDEGQQASPTPRSFITSESSGGAEVEATYLGQGAGQIYIRETGPHLSEGTLNVSESNLISFSTQLVATFRGTNPVVSGTINRFRELSEINQYVKEGDQGIDGFSGNFGGEDFEIELGEATIGLDPAGGSEGDLGFFTGTASTTTSNDFNSISYPHFPEPQGPFGPGDDGEGNPRSVTYTGTYGGQFYGDGSEGSDRVVAGTFAVNKDRSVITNLASQRDASIVGFFYGEHDAERVPDPQ